MTEQEVEQEVNVKNLTAARITPQMIDAVIVSEDYHVFPGTRMTVCCLTLLNGYAVTGESSCLSDINFDADLGRRIARKNARDKIWALEGYLLRDQLHFQAEAHLLGE